MQMPIQGPVPIEGNTQFTGELFVSQEARAYMENLQVAKRSGEDGINKLRDTARIIAPKLGMQKEFEKLNTIISEEWRKKKVRSEEWRKKKVKSGGISF